MQPNGHVLEPWRWLASRKSVLRRALNARAAKALFRRDHCEVTVCVRSRYERNSTLAMGYEADPWSCLCVQAAAGSSSRAC